MMTQYRRSGQVIIYGQADCMACLRCKQLAEIWGLDFVYKDIKKDQEAFKEFSEKSEVPIVPLVVWNGRALMGFEQFSEVLENEINDYGHGAL